MFEALPSLITMYPTNCDSVKFTLSPREIKKRFCKVYENVISNYFIFNENLILGAKSILNSKKDRRKFKTDSPSYQLAFLLSYGVQDTCTVARKFYESIKNYTGVIKRLSEKNPIKLLCLESESLPAVIGICQVINEIVKEFGSVGKFDSREIRILIIDYRGEWRRLCAFIIDMVNSYFTNIELKLDFVENDISCLPQEFIDRIKELDLMVVARCFAKDRCFTENYNFMKIALNEMKKDSILFYFDSSNERYYKNLKHLISKTSFSEIKSCENLHVLFEDLKDEQFYLDLPVSWDPDFQSVIFSTWINVAVQKASFQEVHIPVAANQLGPIKSTEKSKDKKISKGRISLSDIAATSTGGQKNTVNDKKKIKSSSKGWNKSDIPNEQVNAVNQKKKVNSTKKQCNQSNSLSGQTNIVSGKQKSSVIATIGTTKTGALNVRKKSQTQKTHEMLDTLLSILNKQTTDPRMAKSSQKSQCSNVPRGSAISQKQIGQAENQIYSVKELGCEVSNSSIAQTIQPKRKIKVTTSKISATGTDKTVTRTQDDETLHRENDNVSPSAFRASTSQNKKEDKSSKKISKTNTNSKSTTSKKELERISTNKKSPTTTTQEVQSETAVPVNVPKKTSEKNAALTKKSIKNNATEKVKLTGKFAHMDLEKRNKDERHKIRAKKASFAKHANFDYDD